jgi:hypothetical protein
MIELNSQTPQRRNWRHRRSVGAGVNRKPADSELFSDSSRPFARAPHGIRSCALEHLLFYPRFGFLICISNTLSFQ